MGVALEADLAGVATGGGVLTLFAALLIGFARWLRSLSETGTRVLTGDPGRHYVPSNARELAAYEVPTSIELESSTSRRSRVLEILPVGAACAG